MTPEEYQALVQAEMVRQGYSVPEAQNIAYNQAAQQQAGQQSTGDQLTGILANQAGRQAYNYLFPATEAATEGGLVASEAANAAWGGNAALSGGAEAAEAANVAWNSGGSAATNAGAGAQSSWLSAAGPYLGLAAVAIPTYLAIKSHQAARKAQEARAVKRLADLGIRTAGPTTRTWGMSAEERAALLPGSKFAVSRKEVDLTPSEITNYAAWSKIFGNNWADASQEQREQVAKKALGLGIVGEAYDSIQLDPNKNLRKELADFAGGVGIKTDDTYSKPLEAYARQREAMGKKKRPGEVRMQTDYWENKLRDRGAEWMAAHGETPSIPAKGAANPFLVAALKPGGSSIDPGFNLGGSKTGGALAAAIGAIASNPSTPARSKTLSPGIGLDGKRISY